ALTELLGEPGHRFLAQAGTDRGAEILSEVQATPAHAQDIGAADAAIQNAVASMGRVMPELDLRELLTENYGHLRWDDVAARCLTCGNCTMVCPTCFCFSVEDVSGLATGAT